MIYLSKGGAGADSDHTWIRPWWSMIQHKDHWLLHCRNLKVVDAAKWPANDWDPAESPLGLDETC